jgi:branched-chain amino acid transport system ATP-binding protein
MTAALATEDLHTFYGKSHILHGVSLEVAEGKITALLGRNGAGKTTTLRSILGLTPPRQGRVTIFGAETTHWPTYRIAASGVGYVPEGRRIFPNLSVEENLKVPLDRGGPWTVGRIYELFPRLAERKLSRGRQLSGGEQEMLSIGRTLLLNPKLLILDEPSQGLAPLVVREVFRIVSQMRSEGISVLLVEQNARMSLEIADHAYVLDNGSIVYSGRKCGRMGKLIAWRASLLLACFTRSFGNAASLTRDILKYRDALRRARLSFHGAVWLELEWGIRAAKAGALFSGYLQRQKFYAGRQALRRSTANHHNWDTALGDNTGRRPLRATAIGAYSIWPGYSPGDGAVGTKLRKRPTSR